MEGPVLSSFFKKQSKYCEFLLCILASFFIIAITIWNYYPQSGLLSDYSDTKCHAEWATAMYNHTLEGYGAKAYSYPLFFWIAGFIGNIVNSSNWGIVIAGTIFALISYYALYFYIRKKVDYSLYPSLMATIFSLMLSYAWPIDYLFKIMRGKKLSEVYLAALCTNPAHNLTALAPKAFSLIVVILFIEYFKVNRIQKHVQYALGLSVCFLLSVLLKPSFYQFFSFTGTMIVLLYFLKRPSIVKFRFSLIMAMAFIPATLWVLHDMNGSSSRFTIEPFTVLSLHNPTLIQTIESIFIGISFCIFVGVVCVIKKFWTLELTIGWIGYLISVAEFILIIEPAEIQSMNMSWGVMMAMYLLFVMSYVSAEKMYYKKVVSKFTIYGLRFILMWHGLCGIYAHLHWADRYRVLLGW